MPSARITSIGFLFLGLACAIFAVPGECSWLNLKDCTNVTTPVLGLYIIHMRKAGGSTVLRILKNWLIQRGCVTKELTDKHSTMLNHIYVKGVPRLPGNPPFTKEFPQMCPYIDIVHNEYSCSHGQDILKLPSIRSDQAYSAISGTHFSIITTIRDPIERIGSQAFYRQGVGEKTLRIVSNRTRALDLLRNDENIWFRWIKEGNEKNYMGDYYASNYYIKRLTQPSYNDPKLAKTLLACMQKTGPCANVPSPGPELVNTLGQRMHCPTNNQPFNITTALEAAKILLRDHVEFVLTERFHENITANIFSRILHDPNFKRNHHRVPRDNTGHLPRRFGTDSRSEAETKRFSYTSFMPDTVLAYIKEDNRYDIELYDYAVQLYKERYGPPPELSPVKY